MRLVLAICCFLLGSVSFWIAFHPVKSQPTTSGVLAGVKNAITKGTVASAGSSGDETAPAPEETTGSAIQQAINNESVQQQGNQGLTPGTGIANPASGGGAPY